MAVNDKEVLGGLAAFIALLIVGAVFGRLHGTDNSDVKALGDRIVSGLLAVPLISLAVTIAFPKANFIWVIIAPTPLLLYSALLAGVDAGCDRIKNNFTKFLFFGLIILYLFFIILAFF